MERQSIIAQGSLREFKNDGDDLDRYYLTARELVVKGDFYLLPKYNPLLEYASQLNQILLSINQPSRQILTIPDTDYLLDLAIIQNISLLKDKLNRNLNYLVYPYAVTDETLMWIEKLQKLGFNIEAAFPKKPYFDNLYHPAHRGGWGRWVNQPERPSFAELNDLPYPISWIGQGLDQINEAYERVCYSSGQNLAFFKPIFSAGGFTLAKISSKEELQRHYKKLKNQGALDFDGQEIPVEIQAFIPNIEELFSFQYDENGNLLTPRGLSKQVIESNQWQGNFFNGFAVPEEVNNIWQNFRKSYQEYLQKYLGNHNFGWGGVDIAKTSDGRWIILEHNGLRITGAHPAIFLARQLQVSKQPFMTLKSPGEVSSDLITIWNLLEKEKLSFNPSSRRGIFPIVWFPGSGMLFATGENPQELLNKAYNLFAQNNYIKTS
jgi:hypothetical protein